MHPCAYTCLLHVTYSFHFTFSVVQIYSEIVHQVTGKKWLHGKVLQNFVVCWSLLNIWAYSDSVVVVGSCAVGGHLELYDGISVASQISSLWLHPITDQ